MLILPSLWRRTLAYRYIDIDAWLRRPPPRDAATDPPVQVAAPYIACGGSVSLYVSRDCGIRADGRTEALDASSQEGDQFRSDGETGDSTIVQKWYCTVVGFVARGPLGTGGSL